MLRRLASWLWPSTPWSAGKLSGNRTKKEQTSFPRDGRSSSHSFKINCSVQDYLPIPPRDDPRPCTASKPCKPPLAVVRTLAPNAALWMHVPQREKKTNQNTSAMLSVCHVGRMGRYLPTGHNPSPAPALVDRNINPKAGKVSFVFAATNTSRSKMEGSRTLLTESIRIILMIGGCPNVALFQVVMGLVHPCLCPVLRHGTEAAGLDSEQ